MGMLILRLGNLISLETLITKPDLRAKIGIKARKTLVENYSIEVTKDKYLSILNKLIFKEN